MTRLVGGLVFDGTGAPGVRRDVRIAGSAIVELGAAGSLRGEDAIDVSDLAIAPGFIDAHVHADLVLPATGTLEGLIRQGVTTVILGQDGIGYAPASEPTAAYMAAYAAGINGPGWPGVGWRTIRAYLDALDAGTAHHAAVLVPHGCVRADVIGLEDRLATDAELDRMSELVAAGIADGAVGVSTGLHYLPAIHADERELVALGRGAPASVFVTHMRDYEGGRDAAIAESIAVGRATGCRVHLSHLNMRAAEGLPAIERARAEGVRVTYDTYPYLHGMTLLTRMLPAELLAVEPGTLLQRLADPDVRQAIRPFMNADERRWPDRRFGSIQVPAFANVQGMAIDAAALAHGTTVTDLVCDVLVACRLDVAVISSRLHRQGEADVEELMRHPAHVVGSDGILVGEATHPRGHGTFARILGEYVRERGVLSLADAIEHMTSRTADVFGMAGRGRLAPGHPADLVVFDPAAIRDRASYEAPRLPAVGVEHVFVNGTAVLADGRLTGATPGRAIRSAASVAA